MSPRSIALACFFLSGSTGLIYEILWTRFLGGVIGNTHFSITVVVAVFMGGLALGSFYGGRLADRTSNPLRLYGRLVLAVGITCLLIPLAVDAGRPLFRWLYQFHEGNPEAGAALFVRILFCVLLLLIPTSFMGATLPILTRYFARRLDEVGGTIGGLYAVNTLGALAGAMFTGFVGIQTIGLWGCNIVAVAIDVAIGVLILAVAQGADSPPRKTPRNTAAPLVPDRSPANTMAEATAVPFAVRCAVFAFAVSGFANMLLQLAWTKAIVLTIGNSTYAFSLIVSLFILGIALGGGLASIVVDRLKNPSRTLGVLFLLTGTWVAVTIPLLGQFPIRGAQLFDFAGEATYGKLLAIQIGLVSIILLPATILMGTIFPLVGKIRTDTLASIGRSVGMVYFWNTFGSILGTLVAGFVFIPLFGKVYYTLYLGAGLILVTGLALVTLTVHPTPRRRFAVLGATAAVVIVPHLFFLPHGVLGSTSYLWHPSILSQGAYVASNFRNAYDDDHGNLIPTQTFIDRIIKQNTVISYQEGNHAPVAVVASITGAVALRISGKVDASLAPDGGFNYDLPPQVMAGHLPMALHPSPKNVLTLGLGGGITLGTLTTYPVESIDSLEISPEVVTAARDYFGKANRKSVVNPLVRNVVGDGRYHLEYTTKSYDVITSVPSNPWIAGIGNLFTTQFFEICKRRLREDGIICNWIHKVNMRTDDLRTVVRTFVEVFDEHAQLWDLGYDCLLIGSKSPIRFDASRIETLLRSEAIRADLKGLGVDSAVTFLRHFKFDATAMKRFANPGRRKGPLNTDSFPVLEYSCPFGLYGFPLDASKGLVEAGYTRLNDKLVQNLSADNLTRATQLQQGFHHYLSSYIQERELTKAVAASTIPLKNRKDLLIPALQILENLKLMAQATDAAGGDWWLDARAVLLAQSALGVKLPRTTLGGTLAEWFLQMAKKQPTRETGTPYVKQAMDLAHHDPVVALQFADMAMKTGMVPEGLTVLAKAQARFPDDARLFLATGVLQRNSGQLEEGLLTLTKGLDLAENHIVLSQLHCDLGLTHQSMRQFDQARVHYEEALEVNPENAQARTRLANMENFLNSGRPSG
jgi:spermidine synthase